MAICRVHIKPYNVIYYPPPDDTKSFRQVKLAKKPIMAVYAKQISTIKDGHSYVIEKSHCKTLHIEFHPAIATLNMYM